MGNSRISNAVKEGGGMMFRNASFIYGFTYPKCEICYVKLNTKTLLFMILFSKISI